LVAVTLGWFRECLAHPSVPAFAALWSMVAPSWFVFTDKIQNDATVLNGLLCRLAFPWSTIGYFGWSLIVSLTFIWMGTGLYLLFQIWITRSCSNLQLRRRLLLSVFVYIALFAGMCVLTIFLPPDHSIDRRTLTPLGKLRRRKCWVVSPLRFTDPK
jgi:hypothetical protein